MRLKKLLLNIFIIGSIAAVGLAGYAVYETVKKAEEETHEKSRGEEADEATQGPFTKQTPEHFPQNLSLENISSISKSDHELDYITITAYAGASVTYDLYTLKNNKPTTLNLKISTSNETEGTFDDLQIKLKSGEKEVLLFDHSNQPLEELSLELLPKQEAKVQVTVLTDKTFKEGGTTRVRFELEITP